MRLQQMLVSNLALLSAITAYAIVPARAAEPAKAHTVMAGAVKVNVPEGWVSKPTRSNFRLAQFSIPKAEGDKDDTECVVWFYGLNGSGGINGNIERWISQFEPKDRKVKIMTGKSSQGDYELVDITGTWNRPVDMPHGGLKIVREPASRLFGLVLIVRHAGDYFVELMGPEKTVAANLEALRTAIGADAKSEKEKATAKPAPASTASAHPASQDKTAKQKPADEKTPADSTPKK